MEALKCEINNNNSMFPIMEMDYDFRKSQVKLIKHTRFGLIVNQTWKTAVQLVIGLSILFIFYQILYAKGLSPFINPGFIRPPPIYYIKLMQEYRYENWEFLRFFCEYITGDWGESLRIALGVTVMELIKVKLPVTLEILLYSYFLTIFLLPRLVKVVKKWKYLKPLIHVFSSIFVVGIICQYVFGIKLGFLPIIGILKPGRETSDRITGFASIDFLLGRDFASLLDFLYHMILPVTTLTLYGLSCSLTKNKYKGTFTNNKVKLGYLAKGFAENQIPKGIYPSFFPPLFFQMVSGAIIAEEVFNLKGIGMLLIDALKFRDFTLIIAIIYCFFVLGLMIKLGNVIFRGRSYIVTFANSKRQKI